MGSFLVDVSGDFADGVLNAGVVLRQTLPDRFIQGFHGCCGRFSWSIGQLPDFPVQSRDSILFQCLQVAFGTIQVAVYSFLNRLGVHEISFQLNMEGVLVDAPSEASSSIHSKYTCWSRG